MLTNQGRPIIGDLPQPSVLKANITDVYNRKSDNATVLDVVNELGNAYTSVEFIINTTGSSANYIQPSISVGNEVMILKTTHNAKVYALGTVYKSSSSQPSKIYSSSPQHQNHVGSTFGDTIISNGGNEIILATGGRGITLNGNKDVRIQLPKDGVLRISSGDKSMDSPLNGAEFIMSLFEYTGELRAKNAALEQTVDDLVEQTTQTTDFLDALLVAVSPLLPDPTVATALNGLLTNIKLQQNNIVQPQLNETIQLPLRSNIDATLEATTSINTKVRLPKK